MSGKALQIGTCYRLGLKIGPRYERSDDFYCRVRLFLDCVAH